ncbi:MAG: DUF1559 domain-containing protein [Planctomycetes bacterium]|nr:DUF1559 domain-containing protein [Planctomycetota bacterium]
MSRRGTVTLAELLAVVGALAIAATILGVAVSRQRAAREEARRIQCRRNLTHLATGMVTYTGEYGDNRFYPWLAGRPGCGTAANPQFGGAEWLASLHWGRYPIVPDPLVYVCPSSADDNEKGVLLGSIGCPGGKPLPPQAVSYAGMHDRSVGIYVASKRGRGASYATSKLAIRDDFPPDVPMACDDTEEPINHGSRDNGGMNVLFFDSHVEWWTHERVDLERGVGTGELVHLRN